MAFRIALVNNYFVVTDFPVTTVHLEWPARDTIGFVTDDRLVLQFATTKLHNTRSFPIADIVNDAGTPIDKATIVAFIHASTGQPAGGYEPEYQAVLDYAELKGFTVPSDGVNENYSLRISAYKSLGMWNSIDRLYVFNHGDVGLRNFARIDWVFPDDTTLLTENGGLTYGTAGYTGNGANAYLDTNWRQNDVGNNWALNDWFVACRLNQAPNNNRWWGLRESSSRNYFISRTICRLQSASLDLHVGAIATNSTLDYLYSKVGTEAKSFYNTVNDTTLSYSDSGIMSAKLFLLCYNNNGTPATFFDGGLQYWMIGGDGATWRDNVANVKSIMRDTYVL